MNPINIEDAIEKDANIKEAMKEYKNMDEQATAIAEEISKSLVENIVRDKEKFNITTAILATAKALSHLSSFMYDSEEEFLVDVKKARTSVVSDVIPALLDPQPCGLCESCKNGNPEDCINPKVRGEYTTSRFLPVLCNMLIEYDLFNKVIHMYATRDTVEEAFEAETNKEE